MLPDVPVNQLFLIRFDGTVEIFSVSGSYCIFSEEETQWLSVQGESLQAIQQSEPAKYCKLMPGFELNIPLNEPCRQLKTGMHFTVSEYQEPWGNLTNFYVGSHLGCSGDMHILSAQSSSAEIQFEGECMDWDIGSAPPMKIKFRINAPLDSSLEGRSFD